MSIYVQTMLVYVVAAAAYAWLALWAAAGKARLVRMLVLWGAILLLVPIRAYDAGAFVTLCAALTVVLAILVRRWIERAGGVRRKPAASRWQFRLADLFGLMLFLATYLALARESVAASISQYVNRGTVGLALLATPVATIAVCSHFAVVGPRRGTMALIGGLAAVVSATVLRLADAYGYFWEVSMAGSPPAGHESFWLLAPLALLVALVLCALYAALSLRGGRQPSVGVWRCRAAMVAAAMGSVLAATLVWLLWDISWTGPISRNTLKGVALQMLPLVLLGVAVAVATWAWRAGWGGTGPWRRTAGRATAAMLGLVVGLPGAWLYWQMLWLAPFPPVTYEEPNHYAQIAAFAEQFAALYPRRTDNVHPQLPAVVALLAAPNHIPLDVLEAEARQGYPRVAINMRAMLGLAEELERAAEMAANEGRSDDAADLAIALIRLAAMLERGGTSRHVGFHGLAAPPGYRQLARDKLALSPEKTREVIAALERSLDQRDDVVTLRARDIAYAERRHGWRERLRSVLGRFQTLPENYVTPYETSRARYEVLNLQLQTDLAIHRFRRDHGRLPANLSELVPGYLSTVPCDPYDRQPLRYRPDRSSFVLYSIGNDLIDNGGGMRDIQLHTVVRP